MLQKHTHALVAEKPSVPGSGFTEQGWISQIKWVKLTIWFSAAGMELPSSPPTFHMGSCICMLSGQVRQEGILLLVCVLSHIPCSVAPAGGCHKLSVDSSKEVMWK